VRDCVLVAGTSARPRDIGWEAVDPRAAAQRLLAAAAHGPVAVVFGPERSGLSNADLDLCQQRIEIPADPAFPSLNLAAAVQVIAYEIYRAALGPAAPPASAGPPPRHAEIEALHAHVLRTLAALEFYDPERPRRLARRLRDLINRASPDQNEINLLRGILAAMDAVLTQREETRTGHV
jgi:tRNA (cytidine32/uridine32-2'-O)-methyltransferase